MKKSTRKILAVILAIMMVAACFAGCSNGNDTKKSDTLVIGGIGPTTGSAAAYGNAVKNGAQLAIDEINKNGGVNGMKLSLNFQDDENDAEKSVNAYNSLKDAGMKLLMGTVTSNPCKAVASDATSDNMFMLTPSGSAVECTAGDNAFRICFNDPDQGSASAKYIADNKLASKVAIIYNSSDVYSTGIKDTFVEKAAEKNLAIVATEAFTADSSSDFSVQLQKVQESGAELLFLPIYYQEAALILKQANKVGLNVKFFGCDGLDGTIKQLGDDAALANGVMLLTPFVADAADQKTKDFVAAYKAAYKGEVPDQFAADGYDAIYTIKAALEDAKVSDINIDPSELCNLIKKSMLSITVEGLTGTMTWTADGEPNKEPKAMVIQDGSYKAM